MAYEFHYTPTGTGVISGKEVLEQTEDAINDLSGQISGDVQIAIDTANNALNTANTASADAQNAVNTASTAYTAATNAQNTANTAQNTASNALTAAQNAQNDVNALGNRVTTAEGNITQNTNAITGLTTRMGTAEGNIGSLQTAVSTAQATANSAQQTATTARQQSYVFRYSSTALTASSTNSNTLLDNTDNLKVGDKVIDSSGVLFSITAIDTENSTFTIGTALIDLAQDSDVVHKSGDETINGNKTFSSINGVEPSSLSLPSGNSSDRLDISSYITAFDGTTNSYTPLANGWISISVNNCTGVYVFLNNLYGVDNNRPTAGSIRVTLPVLKGITVAIRITGGSLVFARFIPCQGNV